MAKKNVTDTQDFSGFNKTASTLTESLLQKSKQEGVDLKSLFTALNNLTKAVVDNSKVEGRIPEAIQKLIPTLSKVAQTGAAESGSRAASAAASGDDVYATQHLSLSTDFIQMGQRLASAGAEQAASFQTYRMYSNWRYQTNNDIGNIMTEAMKAGGSRIGAKYGQEWGERLGRNLGGAAGRAIVTGATHVWNQAKEALDPELMLVAAKGMTPIEADRIAIFGGSGDFYTANERKQFAASMARMSDISMQSSVNLLGQAASRQINPQLFMAGAQLTRAGGFKGKMAEEQIEGVMPMIQSLANMPKEETEELLTQILNVLKDMAGTGTGIKDVTSMVTAIRNAGGYFSTPERSAAPVQAFAGQSDRSATSPWLMGYFYDKAAEAGVRIDDAKMGVVIQNLMTSKEEMERKFKSGEIEEPTLKAWKAIGLEDKVKALNNIIKTFDRNFEGTSIEIRGRALAEIGIPGMSEDAARALLTKVGRGEDLAAVDIDPFKTKEELSRIRQSSTGKALGAGQIMQTGLQAVGSIGREMLFGNKQWMAANPAAFLYGVYDTFRNAAASFQSTDADTNLGADPMGDWDSPEYRAIREANNVDKTVLRDRLSPGMRKWAERIDALPGTYQISGFRSAERNASTPDAVVNSKHMRGLALDFLVDDKGALAIESDPRLEKQFEIHKKRARNNRWMFHLESKGDYDVETKEKLDVPKRQDETSQLLRTMVEQLRVIARNTNGNSTYLG